MQWRGQNKSGNVEDRRGMTGSRAAKGGGIIAVIIVLISLFTGKDLTGLLQFFDPGTPSQTSQVERQGPRPDDDLADMISVILSSTEEVWSDIFQQQNATYQPPNLVMFDYSTPSACGMASSAMGPFYCPGDQKVYIDLSFCEELRTKFKAPGDFAVAYVIAHEVGHHVQDLMGITGKMAQLRQQVGETEYNKFSVRLELQADFYAGLWARYNQQMKNVIEPSDIQEALEAANAIGDDTLQRQYQGSVTPDAFTHGTSEQRMYWFKKGYETGDFFQGNTFAANSF